MNAIYARQSLDKKDSISIETQIEQAIEADPDVPYKTYIDKGFSGKNTKRPGFREMMGDVRSGKINKVIVYKIDRFSRSLLDFSVLWHELNSHGVEFVSIKEQFDTSTPMGKAMLFITEIFAELERETTSLRITDNYYSRTKLGRWPGGPAPFGFYNGSILEDGQKVTSDIALNKDVKKIPTLIMNNDISHVLNIYLDYAAGLSLRSIAIKLNSESVGSGKWTNSIVSKVLKNPVYVKADADIYTYFKALGVKVNNSVEEFNGINAATLLGKYDSNSRTRDNKDRVLSIANWEGFIDANLWLKCQARLKYNQQIKGTGKGKMTWLSGKVKCGDCGRSVQVFPHYSKKNGKERPLLCCTGHTSGRMCDHIIQIKIPELESIVSSELQKELEKAENEEQVEKEVVFSSEEKISLVQIDEQIENLINCIGAGEASEITMTHINRKLEELEKEKKEILANMSSKKVTKKKIKYKPINIDELTFDEKKVVVEDYIEKISIYSSGYVEICWKV